MHKTHRKRIIFFCLFVSSDICPWTLVVCHHGCKTYIPKWKLIWFWMGHNYSEENEKKKKQSHTHNWKLMLLPISITLFVLKWLRCKNRRAIFMMIYSIFVLNSQHCFSISCWRQPQIRYFVESNCFSRTTHGSKSNVVSTKNVQVVCFRCILRLNEWMNERALSLVFIAHFTCFFFFDYLSMSRNKMPLSCNWHNKWNRFWPLFGCAKPIYGASFGFICVCNGSYTFVAFHFSTAMIEHSTIWHTAILSNSPLIGLRSPKINGK